jgi:GTP-binding protein HflX
MRDRFLDTTPVTIERAVLVGLNADVFTKEETATEETLDELEALLETAGGECCARLLQNRHAPDPHSFIGEGKVEELCELIAAHDANMVIFDNDLTPSQNRALEQLTKVTVLDRSALILDIFAQRAKTREGKLQVELAQYKYLLPRLTGMWTHLERQTASGGRSPIGTRGPGETQLETDRRLIRQRITRLTEELAEVRRVRGVQRERRQKNSVPVVAIVGYTNAGKSTLLNLLTDAGIPANNRLFDTLDTTTRRFTVSDTCQVLLSDTVGFIAKLPHHLIEAFKATLEELQYADLLLHVIDASDPNCRDHIEVVNSLIAQLAKPGVPVIEAYNKCDLVTDDDIPRGENRVAISAREGRGIDELCHLIEENLGRGLHRARFLLPYSMAGQVDALHQTAQVISLEYTDVGILIEVVCDDATYGRLSNYRSED